MKQSTHYLHKLRHLNGNDIDLINYKDHVAHQPPDIARFLSSWHKCYNHTLDHLSDNGCLSWGHVRSVMHADKTPENYAGVAALLLIHDESEHMTKYMLDELRHWPTHVRVSAFALIREFAIAWNVRDKNLIDLDVDRVIASPHALRDRVLFRCIQRLQRDGEEYIKGAGTAAATVSMFASMEVASMGLGHMFEVFAHETNADVPGGRYIISIKARVHDTDKCTRCNGLGVHRESLSRVVWGIPCAFCRGSGRQTKVDADLNVIAHSMEGEFNMPAGGAHHLHVEQMMFNPVACHVGEGFGLFERGYGGSWHRMPVREDEHLVQLARGAGARFIHAEDEHVVEPHGLPLMSDHVADAINQLRGYAVLRPVVNIDHVAGTIGDIKARIGCLNSALMSDEAYEFMMCLQMLYDARSPIRFHNNRYMFIDLDRPSYRAESEPYGVNHAPMRVIIDMCKHGERRALSSVDVHVIDLSRMWEATPEARSANHDLETRERADSSGLIKFVFEEHHASMAYLDEKREKTRSEQLALSRAGAESIQAALEAAAGTAPGATMLSTSAWTSISSAHAARELIDE